MKNTLVKYQGGGYDGCFWEWNFAYYDINGNFNDVYSSGCSGCKTHEKLQEVLLDIHTRTYDLDSQKDVDNFVDNTIASLVMGVAKWLDKNIGIGLEGKCYDCGHKDIISEMLTCNPEGQGGIVISDTGLICYDCYYEHKCSDCGEFYEDRGTLDSENNLCEYCIERQKEEAKMEVTNELKDNCQFGNIKGIKARKKLEGMDGGKDD